MAVSLSPFGLDDQMFPVFSLLALRARRIRIQETHQRQEVLRTLRHLQPLRVSGDPKFPSVPPYCAAKVQRFTYAVVSPEEPLDVSPLSMIRRLSSLIKYLQRSCAPSEQERKKLPKRENSFRYLIILQRSPRSQSATSEIRLV